ncbi:AMP-binding protein [Paenibacillus soyae]|uniref:AMP-binding protein n=1 Tax=Paenibacillus soyae TaxID=2969249 RepID=A0A9X2SAW0_9BACL|nr:AMP-binding protein [Paenibacillus soyae]MCR2806390.1 AMP-binding protein [Paenibacillus soyae]
MGILQLLRALAKMRLGHPAGLYRLLAVICRYGINVMALLKLAERTYGARDALADDRETLSFRELSDASERLARSLRDKYGLAPGRKVALLCRNHASLAKSVFAVTYTGADLYLLNTEMSPGQYDRLAEEYRFDLLIHDEDWATKLRQTSYRCETLLSYHEQKPSVSSLSASGASSGDRLGRRRSGRLMLLTGGTTGRPKQAPHRPSLFTYLAPFTAMLSRLRLMRYETGYVATPIYHGYGVALLLLFVATGTKTVLTSVFRAEQACELIQKHRVEVAAVVPLMLHKMLDADDGALASLRCIASGGAELSPKLARRVSRTLGDVLYNLYGTSEGGLLTIATPRDLSAAELTVGKRIAGVPLRVLRSDGSPAVAGEIGRLCLRKRRTFGDRRSGWLETGDRGYRDERGRYFLCGREDDMIVSAGENVFPSDVEQVLLLHPDVEDAAVVGIPDEAFGQRLRAAVQPAAGAELTEESLRSWLQPRIARYQMPKEIMMVDRIPYTSVGKRDRKQLKITT